jgi:hypothetical protein
MEHGATIERNSIVVSCGWCGFRIVCNGVVSQDPVGGARSHPPRRQREWLVAVY